MVRCGYQDGCLFIRGKKRKVWVARWREPVIQADGSVQRVLRSEVLGDVSQIPTRRQARVLLQTRLSSLNAGLRRAEATMPFGVFVAQNFEPLVLPTLKPATREIYTLLLRKHILPQFRDSRLCEISRVEIQKFVMEKLKEGYAWETADHIRSVLSRVLRSAVEWTYLSDNPVRGVKMPERWSKRPPRFLSMDEVRRLVRELEEPSRTIVLIAVMTGLRIGEILALRWGRINFAAGTLRVEETCYKGTFGTPKTRASRREVPMTDAVAQAILILRAKSYDASDERLVFATRKGTPLASNNLRKRQLHPACQRAGIERIDWHSLRHTHGTLLHEQGTPLRIAQAQLGHSQMTTTLKIYTHASEVAQREAVSQLENSLFPNVPKLWKTQERPN